MASNTPSLAALRQIASTLSEIAENIELLGEVDASFWAEIKPTEMLGDLAGDLRSLAARTESICQRLAHDQPLLDPDLARANGRPVRSMELFTETHKEGEFWRWRMVDCDGREYMDGGNFRHGVDAARSLLEAAQLHRLESAKPENE